MMDARIVRKWGQPAVYTPKGGGESTDVLIVPKNTQTLTDLGAGVLAVYFCQEEASGFPQRPAEGDSIVVHDQPYRIFDVKRDVGGVDDPTEGLHIHLTL